MKIFTRKKTLNFDYSCFHKVFVEFCNNCTKEWASPEDDRVAASYGHVGQLTIDIYAFIRFPTKIDD